MVLLLGWLFLPIYIASGVKHPRHVPTTQSKSGFFVLIPLSHHPTLLPAGEDHAGVPTEALRWQENAALHRHPVSIHLHFHKDIGKIVSRR